MAAKTADVVVVGGGINGVMAAWELARRGVRNVVLVERGRLASGPTGHSGAVIRCHYSTPDLVRLAMEGRQFFQHATDLVNDDCGFRDVGFLAVVGPDHVASLEARVAMQRSVGLRVDLLRGADLHAVEQELDVNAVALAAYEPESGHADPVRATRAIGRAAAALGVEIREGCTVRDIRVVDGVVTSVETDTDSISTRRVLCAAGPWTRQLVARVGHDVLPTSILRNAMGYYLRPDHFEKPHAVLIDYVRRFYARPDGRYTLAGTVDESENQTVLDPDNYDRSVHSSEIATYGKRMAEAYPSMLGASERGGWVGLYDVSPDWLHLIDELPGARGLWILCGTSGHGFKLAPAIGRLVATLLTEGAAAAPEAAIFRLDRLSVTGALAGFGVLA